MDGGVSGGYVVGASGSAEGNHVVVESGRVNDFIYGGNIGGATPTGHATGNTVEISGGEIHDHVYGGFNGGGSGTISGNILNVKASASAQNIHHFDKINFYFSGREHTEPVAQGRQCAPRARLSLRIEGGQPRQLRSEHQRLAGQASGHHGRTLRQVGVLSIPSSKYRQQKERSDFLGGGVRSLFLLYETHARLVIICKQRVMCEKYHVFAFCLTNEQTIKRIFVWFCRIGAVQ